MTDSTFHIDKDGEVTRFTVKPAGPPWPIGYMLFAVPLFLVSALAFFVALLSGETDSLVLSGIFAALTGSTLYWIKSRNSKYRRQISFSVSQSGIDIDGKHFDKDKISRVVMRNHMSGASLGGASGSVVFYNPNSLSGNILGMSAAASTAAANSRRENDRKLTIVSWRLDVEANGDKATLGCGMDEGTASDLAQAIGKAMG